MLSSSTRVLSTSLVLDGQLHFFPRSDPVEMEDRPGKDLGSTALGSQADARVPVENLHRGMFALPGRDSPAPPKGFEEFAPDEHVDLLLVQGRDAPQTRYERNVEGFGQLGIPIDLR
jgi:hypothetical protein